MPDGQEWTTYFFIIFILSSTYFTVYRRGSNGFITEKTILFQGSREGLTFLKGGVQLFPGVVLIIISKETHIT